MNQTTDDVFFCFSGFRQRKRKMVRTNMAPSSGPLFRLYGLFSDDMKHET